MRAIRFTATVKLNGINPYVAVSAAQAAKIRRDWRKPMPVCVRVDGEPAQPWRTNLMPMGNGGFYLYLHGTIRKLTGTNVGDRVRLEVRFDERYRGGPTQPMPSWFRRALSTRPKAKAAYAALAPSRKKELLRYLSRLKSPEARQRNMRLALRALGGGAVRYMGRLWRGGK